jgi:MSHA biogenesis protein MshM
MYEQHFGLSEQPFSLTPDTGYFFNYRSHQEALNVLLVAVESGEGFLKLTGEVGTGKTLLCRKLLNALGDDYVTAYIPNPFLDPDTLRRAVAEELGVVIEPTDSQHELIKRLHARLIQLAGEGRRVVLCVDEAQALSRESLEALRLLTNFETERRKLLQVVLFGQPELNERLAAPELRQLKQRISFSYHLHPMDRQGVASYLTHRLGIAGHNGVPLFRGAAVRSIHRASQGVPRLINILAHKALMVAYGRGARSVTPRDTRLAIRDTEGAVHAVPGLRRVGYLGLLVTALTVGVLVWQGMLG